MSQNEVGKVTRLHHTDDFDCDHCRNRAVIKVLRKNPTTNAVYYDYYCKDHEDLVDTPQAAFEQ